MDILRRIVRVVAVGVGSVVVLVALSWALLLRTAPTTKPQLTGELERDGQQT
jgi:hypothetical protein